MQGVRILDLPKCRMVSSGTGMFGSQNFDRFCEWFTRLPKSLCSRDFLYHDGRGFCWLYLYEEGMNPPEEFQIVDFEGGFYAVATDIDQQTDVAAMETAVNAFLRETGFERDPSRFEMGNIITSPSAAKIMGYCQMDYFSPIRKKA